MAKVGDRVTVNISNAVISGTAIAGAPMSVSGKILEDLGHSWLVFLELAVGGKDRIVIPKDAELLKKE